MEEKTKKEIFLRNNQIQMLKMKNTVSQIFKNAPVESLTIQEIKKKKVYYQGLKEE